MVRGNNGEAQIGVRLDSSENKHAHGRVVLIMRRDARAIRIVECIV